MGMGLRNTATKRTHFTDLHVGISTSNITVAGRTSMEVIFQSPVSNLQTENAQLIPVVKIPASLKYGINIKSTTSQLSTVNSHGA